MSDPRATRRRPGWGYLVFAVLALAVAGSFILAPGFWGGLFAAPAKPADEGAAPAVSGDLQGLLAQREQQARVGAAGAVATRVDRVQPPPAPASGPARSANDAGATAVKATPRDEQQALKQLARAEQYYRAMRWDDATTEALRVGAFDASPRTKGRARDVATGAPRLKALFAALGDERDDPNELSRNYDTSPGLVVLDRGDDKTFAVPLDGDGGRPVERDAVAFVELARRGGQVHFKIQARPERPFISSVLEDDRIGTVRAADVPAIIAERRAEFDAKLARLSGGPLAGDALAWYEAGKYAYRNRLDDRVVDQLEKALLIDPELVRSVRESRAGELLGRLVFFLKAKNQTQAATIMGIIEKRYKDTDNGRQARLRFDGDVQAMLAAAKEADQRRADEERRRREEARARAEVKKKEGDDQAAQLIAKSAETPAPETEPETAAPAADADEAKADALVQEGKKPYSDAMQMGAVPKRNTLYEEAERKFRQAKAIYLQLYQKRSGDVGLQEKIHEVGQYIFTCRKYHTF